MTRLDRRILLAGLASGALSACAGPLRVGEGKKKPRGGIGGTGIIGTLTDFGSLILNGLQVELTTETRISNALGRLGEDALTIGQNLTIEAETLDGVLVARRVHVTYPVIGRVDVPPSAGSSALVDGIEVRPEPGMIGSLKAGERVAVSGVWRGAQVIASRVDTLDPEGPSVLAGVVTQAPSGRGVAVGNRRMVQDSSLFPHVGSFVTLIWGTGATARYPSQIIPDRFTGAAGPLTALSVEGYLDPVDTPPAYTLAGLGHSFDSNAKLGAFKDLRALFNGGYDGTFVVTEGLPVPEDLAKRRAVSRAWLAGLPQGLPVR